MANKKDKKSSHQQQKPSSAPTHAELSNFQQQNQTVELLRQMNKLNVHNVNDMSRHNLFNNYASESKNAQTAINNLLAMSKNTISEQILNQLLNQDKR